MKRFLPILFLIAGMHSTPAVVLLKERFDYPNGPLVAGGGGAWEHLSGTENQLAVVDGHALLNLADGEDAQIFLAPTPATDVVYAGFTARFTTLPSGGGSYFALFKDTGATAGFRARVWALTNGAAPGKLRLGLSSTTGSVNVTNPADLSLNTNYRVVLRLVNATGEAMLWIDPKSENDVAAVTSESPASSTVVAFALRQPGIRGALEMDDLVVGEAFSEVLTTVPPVEPPLPPPAFSVLTYNTHGNMIADWTTNSAQVRAIGRQMQLLQPDLITFQEIPMTNDGWTLMPQFVAAYLPGYHLATNSGTDGFIRSAILSRFPIARSKSWLDGADLKPFGYTNTTTSQADNFTRDLFEAEINVPGLLEPLHLFTTHLKSGSGLSDSSARRAAEAAAISNFFASVFLPAHGSRPYLLTGDLNEDIAHPATGSGQPIQQLVNAFTGLHLTTPRNPITSSAQTFSIRALPLSERYDYILPGGLLFSNYAGSLVFRSDLLTNPPPPLLSGDGSTASDHLPVMMFFAIPDQPFLLLSASIAGGAVVLSWETQSNEVYGVESSLDLLGWTVLASHLTATGTNATFTTGVVASRQFFRVFRN